MRNNQVFSGKRRMCKRFGRAIIVHGCQYKNKVEYLIKEIGRKCMEV